MATSTPWGESQYADIHVRGLVTYATASHGGIKVARSLQDKLSEYTKNHGIKKDTALWYEEDLDYLLPLYELSKYPDIRTALESSYRIPTLDDIKKCFSDYPDEVL